METSSLQLAALNHPGR